MKAYLLTCLALMAASAETDDAKAGALSACGPQSVELFSCTLKSRESVAFCINKTSPKTEFVFSSDRKPPRHIMASELKQIIGVAFAGSSTIVRGKTSFGFITLYLDNNTAEPSGTAIETNESNRVTKNFCLAPTVRNQNTSWKGLSDIWIGGVNIFALTRVGIAKPFDFSTQSATELWRSWPKEKPTP